MNIAPNYSRPNYDRSENNYTPPDPAQIRAQNEAMAQKRAECSAQVSQDWADQGRTLRPQDTYTSTGNEADDLMATVRQQTRERALFDAYMGDIDVCTRTPSTEKSSTSTKPADTNSVNKTPTTGNSGSASKGSNAAIAQGSANKASKAASSLIKP